jgi:hypothetical protein
MLITYSNVVTINFLKTKCRAMRVQKYSSLKKKDLLYLVNSVLASRYIQRYFRSCVTIGDICPITLEKITYPFIGLKNGSKFRYYDMNEYIDPITKEFLSIKTLENINAIATYYKRKTIKISAMNINIDIITITCCIDNIINRILDISVINLEYINDLIVELLTYCSYIMLRHNETSVNVLTHFIDKLDRHPDPTVTYITNCIRFITLRH